jgi:hypothetical protein
VEWTKVVQSLGSWCRVLGVGCLGVSRLESEV